MKFLIKSTSGHITDHLDKLHYKFYHDMVDGEKIYFIEIDSLDDLIIISRLVERQVILTPRGYYSNYIEDDNTISLSPLFHQIEIYDDYRE